MRGYFRKRGSKWSFTVDIGRDPVTGKRRQKTVSGFRTKKEAEAACAELIAQIEAGQYREPANITLGQFIDDFMAGERQRIRETTWNNQMHLVKKHIIPALGHLKLTDITPIVLQHFYQSKVAAGLANSYIKSMHSILSKALRTAEKWGMIQRNIAALVAPPRVQKPEMRVWTPEQIRRFLKTTVDRRFHIAYVLAIYTGMRRGEILGLKWSDIDLERGVIHIQRTLYKTNGKLIFQEPKTRGSKRSIVISPTVITALKRHRAKQNEMRLKIGSAYQDHDLVIANWTGTPVNPVDLHKDFRAAVRLAGVPAIRFHDLRHTHATLLLQLGEHPKVVAERLGHASVTITLDTYSHVLPSMQKRLADRLESVLQNESEPGKESL